MFISMKKKKSHKTLQETNKKQHTGTQKEEETVLCQKSGLTDHSSGVFFSRIMLRAIPGRFPVAYFQYDSVLWTLINTVKMLIKHSGYLNTIFIRDIIHFV